MVETLLATIVGFSVEFLFAFLKLPVPAPATLSGVMGIVGIFFGICSSKSLTWTLEK